FASLTSGDAHPNGDATSDACRDWARRFRLCPPTTGGWSGGFSMERIPAARHVVARLLLLAVAIAGFARPVVAEDSKGPSYTVLDPSLVYLGNPRLFRRPCVVSADRVYRSIPEYIEILTKNLTDKDVRYHFLLRKATEKFATAIRAVSVAGAYD